MTQNMAKTIFTSLLLLAPVCYALQEDKHEVFYLSSDEADICQDTRKGTFKGNVQIDQGTTHLRSSTAHTLSNDKNKLVKAAAKGNSKSQAHFWTLLTKNKPELHAWADLIYYFPEKHRIELIGNASIAQGENTFKAPKIVYDTEKQHVLTESNSSNRTTITFYPEKKA